MPCGCEPVVGQSPGWQLVGQQLGVLQRAECRRPPHRHAPQHARSGPASRSPLRVLGQLLGATDHEDGRLSVPAEGAPSAREAALLSLLPWLQFRVLEADASCRMHAVDSVRVQDLWADLGVSAVTVLHT